MMEAGITHSWSDPGACSPNWEIRAALVPCSKPAAEVGPTLRLSVWTISGPMEGKKKEESLWNWLGLKNHFSQLCPSCCRLKGRLWVAAQSNSEKPLDEALFEWDRALLHWCLWNS